MQIFLLLSSILNKKQVFNYLLVAVGVLLIFSFYINFNEISGDQYTYLYYVKGLHQGKYSYWYFLKDYLPDTFRNPGYPIFLYLLSFINDSVLFIKITQLAIQFFTILLMFKVIDKFENSLVLKNIFLILLCINFVALQYPAFIYPETLMLFLITLIVYIEISYANNSWKKAIILAIIYGYTFQVRPVIIFLPILRFLFYVYYYKKVSLVKNVTFVLLFLVTLLPYGLWNLKHHKQFKITPIEGGAGAMYLGYWSPKMINHVESKYWRNVMYKDILFNFTEMKDVPHNIVLFDNEIDSVNQICAQYLTKTDSTNLLIMKENQHLFVTLNVKFTTEREKILKTLAINHYLNDWKYSIKLKFFTFFRLWYTGLSADDSGKHQNSGLIKIPIVMAFVTTFLTLIIFIIYFLYCLWKRRDILYVVLFPILLCLYFGVFHVPFVIQSRYTIPVRFLYLFVLSFMIYKIHFSTKNANEPHQNI